MRSTRVLLIMLPFPVDRKHFCERVEDVWYLSLWTIRYHHVSEGGWLC